MALSNSQYEEIMHEYNKRQLKSADELNRRTEEVIRVIPEYKVCLDEISSLSISAARQGYPAILPLLLLFIRILTLTYHGCLSFCHLPVILMIILPLLMSVRTARIRDTSVMKSAIVLSRQKLTCSTDSLI